MKQVRCKYQSISNPLEIIPPSLWFAIEESKCIASIRNDVERSRITREGMLSTNLKGNMLNKISYDSFDEDIGSIQETEQCFCVGFAVVKDTCDDFIKWIGSELRACLSKKCNLIDRSHINVSQLDQISKAIYNKFRVFLIFDTRSQPGRLLSIYSCFYPNVRFTIQKIQKKQKQGFKFGSNQVFQQLQAGQIINNFGFLSLDSKNRLLMIKKDDPQLINDNLVGVWVISSFNAKRSRKQFGKQDAIWLALFDFFTNQQAKKKVSILANQRGLLIYFGMKKQRNRLQSPEFYLFQPSTKSTPRWSFLTKSQFVSDLSKSCEIKIDFIDNTIVQQKEYSEFSDQTMSYQNVNRQNALKQTKNKIQSNLSFQTVNQTKHNVKQLNQQDQKSILIKQLRAQLQKYKLKCVQLQTINRILIQQKMSNQMMYPNQYQMMGPNPQMIAYNQMPTFAYPLSYSQVSNHNPYTLVNQKNPYQKPNIEINDKIENSPNNSINSPTNSKNLTNIKSENQKNSINVVQKATQRTNKIKYSFPEPSQQQITFGIQNNGQSINKNNLFLKKSHSQGTESQTQAQKKQQIVEAQKSNQREIQKQKDRNEQKFQNDLQITLTKKDLRNISFQDSFAQYHSQGEDEPPKFKFAAQSKNLLKNIQSSSNESSTKKVKKQQIQQFTKSPQFKQTQDKVDYNKQYQPYRKQLNVVQKYSRQYGKEQKKEQSPKRTEPTNRVLKNLQQVVPSRPESKLNQPKKQQKIEYNTKPAKLIEKIIDSSSNDQEQYNKKIPVKQIKVKQSQRSSPRKPNKTLKISESDSGDSDEDIQLKKLRLTYLNR